MRVTRSLATLVLAAGMAAGCGSSDPLGPDFETRLSVLGGCGDVWFYAVDAADEVLVTFAAPGLIEAAEGETTTTTFDLPDEGVELIVEVGSYISDAICDDVIENGPRVDRTWRAVAGEAAVTIRPQGESWGARGDLRLTDVVLRDDDGHTVVIERLDWSDIFVGWLPG